jgi:hypothetical protein
VEQVDPHWPCSLSCSLLTRVLDSGGGRAHACSSARACFLGFGARSRCAVCDTVLEVAVPYVIPFSVQFFPPLYIDVDGYRKCLQVQCGWSKAPFLEPEALGLRSRSTGLYAATDEPLTVCIRQR